MSVNNYYNLEWASQQIQEGRHRHLVGGMWDEIGELQYRFLRTRGLQKNMRLVDVGCGCLRGGVHFVEYLNPACYFGVDISQDMLNVGYDVELGQLGLQHKLPREHLLCTDEFRFDRLNTTFHMGIALSLFTHLPLNHIRLCLHRLAKVFLEGSAFYATFFLCEVDQPWSEATYHQQGGITTYPERDPYHYTTEDIHYCVAGLPWSADIIGAWGHPRDQRMVMFTKKSSA